MADLDVSVRKFVEHHQGFQGHGNAAGTRCLLLVQTHHALENGVVGGVEGVIHWGGAFAAAGLSVVSHREDNIIRPAQLLKVHIHVLGRTAVLVPLVLPFAASAATDALVFGLTSGLSRATSGCFANSGLLQGSDFIVDQRRG